MDIQEADKITVEIPLARLSKHRHAVQAAVTDHIALTEGIFFNSLP